MPGCSEEVDYPFHLGRWGNNKWGWAVAWCLISVSAWWIYEKFVVLLLFYLLFNWLLGCWQDGAQCLPNAYWLWILPVDHLWPTSWTMEWKNQLIEDIGWSHQTEWIDKPNYRQTAKSWQNEWFCKTSTMRGKLSTTYGW